MTKQILLTRQSPAYWRVTFNRPPLKIFGRRKERGHGNGVELATYIVEKGKPLVTAVR